MNIKEWLLTVMVVAFVYLTGYIPFPNYGSAWFGFSAHMSLLAIYVILAISHSKTSISLALIELAAIIVISISWYQFSNQAGLVYDFHEWIIEALAVSQVIILAIGGPWRGMVNAIKRLGMGYLFRLSHLFKYSLGGKGYQVKVRT